MRWEGKSKKYNSAISLNAFNLEGILYCGGSLQLSVNTMCIRANSVTEYVFQGCADIRVNVGSRTAVMMHCRHCLLMRRKSKGDNCYTVKQASNLTVRLDSTCPVNTILKAADMLHHFNHKTAKHLEVLCFKVLSTQT